jgi:Kef-type K+ transport system membrane component KefB
MQELFHNGPLLLLGVATIIGFYCGGLARRCHLPSLIGFMLLGVIMGPSLFNFFNDAHLDHFSFITEIALGFVAFGIGTELRMAGLRRLGRGIIAIILAESFMAFFVVMFVVYALTRSWPAAILFGAVAPASAPAGTVAVIQEYRARGALTQALYAVVGFDDGLAILIFGFAAALAKRILTTQLHVAGMGGGMLAALKQPAIEIAGSLVVGTVLGLLFCQLVRRLDSSRDMLIMTVGIVFIATGLSIYFHLSLILTNMIIGFILANTRREAFVHKVTAPLHEIMPLMFLLFFCLAGAHLRIDALPRLGLLGLLYILARTAGLISGARLGGRIGKVEDKIRKYIGLGILSQAGVAIGLSLIIRHDFDKLMRQPGLAEALNRFAAAHPDLSPLAYDPLFIGSALITTITATCIVFEIIGPILTKAALTRAGEIER